MRQILSSSRSRLRCAREYLYERSLQGGLRIPPEEVVRLVISTHCAMRRSVEVTVVTVTLLVLQDDFVSAMALRHCRANALRNVLVRRAYLLVRRAYLL